MWKNDALQLAIKKVPRLNRGTVVNIGSTTFIYD